MKASPVRLAVAAALVGATLTPPLAADQGGVGSARLQLVEATIQDLQKALQTKLVTSEQLVAMYHARMAAYEDSGPHINAYIHVNANADSMPCASMRAGIPAQSTVRCTAYPSC